MASMKKYRCKKCKRVFPSRNTVKHHLKRVHKIKNTSLNARDSKHNERIYWESIDL